MVWSYVHVCMCEFWWILSMKCVRKWTITHYFRHVLLYRRTSSEQENSIQISKEPTNCLVNQTNQNICIITHMTHNTYTSTHQFGTVLQNCITTLRILFKYGTWRGIWKKFTRSERTNFHCRYRLYSYQMWLHYIYGLRSRYITHDTEVPTSISIMFGR